MASPQAQNSVTLDSFLGLLTNVSPDSIPEGGSPLNWDCSFLTGQVGTRPGLVSVYGGTVIVATTIYIPSENIVPDQSGNSFYTVAALTNWFSGHVEFVPNTTTYVDCVVRIPNNVASTPNASVILEICSSDATSGHTANFQTSDGMVIPGGSFNVPALASASAQSYATTATAYQRVTLTFPVQSAIVANAILIIKIAVAPSGTNPTGNMFVFPYLKLDCTFAA